MSQSSSPFRVALVGCGAVARESLLPVLAGHEAIRLGPLVDRDERRARELADAYSVATVLTDMSGLTRELVDGVVLATPPGHHAGATISLAGKGLHVFVEKPMAIAAADAEAMVQAATQNKVALAVGHYRRFLPSVQLLKSVIEQHEFGALVSVDAEEGGPYGWPLASLEGLRRSSGGGGTLIDLGSHVIDLVLYVTGGIPTLNRYEDNERGGIETDCLLNASLRTAHGSVPFRLELSRTRELRGSVRVTCEEAVLELPRANFTEILVHPRKRSSSATPIEFKAAWPGQSSFIGYEAFRREFDDWLQAAATGREPVLSGRSVVPAVKLIEDAYASRTALTAPVEDAPSVLPTVHGTRKRVLVSGAGGFLGGRTVELLRHHYGYEVAPLVREPRSAARLARWPHEILLGDITSREDMDRVVAGCDAVVHCAVGTSWKVEETRRATVDGTKTLAEAALAAGVSRFVHISTLFVHQRAGLTAIDEQTALQPLAHDNYGQNKLAAEEALAALGRKGLSHIVLRPTRIYGPYSRTFTLRPLQALSQGRLAIGGDADVPANMVYVDNVVSAIVAALEAPPTRSGSAYLVTDREQVSLREFYQYFGQSAGLLPRLLPEAVEHPPQADGGGMLTQFANGVVTIAKSKELRGIVRRVFETDPIGTLPRTLWDRSPRLQQRLLRRFGADAAVVYRGTAAADEELLVYFGEPALVSGQKISSELGASFVPREDAMAKTLEWSRYARLIPTNA